MSATQITLQFSAVVADYDRLPVDTGPDDVTRLLAEAMRQAGQRFIDDHPDLFATPDLL
jgi:hypothetical protein